MYKRNTKRGARSRRSLCTYLETKVLFEFEILGKHDLDKTYARINKCIKTEGQLNLSVAIFSNSRIEIRRAELNLIKRDFVDRFPRNHETTRNESISTCRLKARNLRAAEAQSRRQVEAWGCSSRVWSRYDLRATKIQIRQSRTPATEYHPVAE